MVNQIISSPNMTVFKPMQSSGAPFAITKAFTPQQEKEAETHKEKKTGKIGKAIAISTIATGLIIIGLMKGPKGLRKVLKTFEKKTKNLTENNKSLTFFQKQAVKGLDVIKKHKGYANSILNFATFKDIWFKHNVTDKVPFLQSFSKGISKVFERISINSALNRYAATTRRFAGLYTKFDEINAKLPVSTRTEIEKEIHKFKYTFDTNMGIGHVNDRLLVMKKSLEGLDKEYWGKTLGNIKSFATKNESYNKFLADEFASGKKEVNGKAILETANSLEAKMRNILKLYEKAGLPEKEYQKLSKDIEKSIKSMHKSVNSETDKLFDKLRDIKLGSAPTDFLGIVGSFVAAGLGLAKADGKDEKVSVSLQYGIPAIGGVAISLVCATSLIAAGPSLIIGTISGIALSKLGGFIDKNRKHIPNTNELANDAKELVMTGSISKKQKSV